MTEILKSKAYKEKLIGDLKEKIKNLKRKPCLAIIRIGEKADDISYERGLKKTAGDLGIEIRVTKFLVDSTTEDVLTEIKKLNEDDSVSGILIFRPFPTSFDKEKIENAIDPKKDCDCISPINKAKIYDGDVSGFIPASPLAAVRLMESYGYKLDGKALVINRSQVVGRPLAMLLLDRNATVAIAHSKTKNLKALCKNADYIFTAMGGKNNLDRSYFTEDSIICDLSIGLDENGKLCGDLIKEEVDGFVKAYTPVPGGVGNLTNLLLLESICHE